MHQADFDRRVALARSVIFAELRTWDVPRLEAAHKKLAQFFGRKKKPPRRDMVDAEFLILASVRAMVSGRWGIDLLQEELNDRLNNTK